MDSLLRILQPNRKCIINADLDGLLSGLLLHQMLGWDIAGFSMCNGTPADEIWLELGVKMEECVFIDLPVVVRNIDCIDQHFDAITQLHCEGLKSRQTLANPNVVRDRYYLSPTSGYTTKYPFGTVHYIIAGLENLGYVPELKLAEDLGGFAGLDILLRADRVVSNSRLYAQNCQDWARWLYGQSKHVVTAAICRSVFNVNDAAVCAETQVENYLKSLGCARADGDFSNLLQSRDYQTIQKLVSTIANNLGLPVFTLPEFLQPQQSFHGYRRPIDFATITSVIRTELLQNDIFTFALVSKREVSFTKKK